MSEHVDLHHALRRHDDHERRVCRVMLFIDHLVVTALTKLKVALVRTRMIAGGADAFSCQRYRVRQHHLGDGRNAETLNIEVRVTIIKYFDQSSSPSRPPRQLPPPLTLAARLSQSERRS